MKNRKMTLIRLAMSCFMFGTVLTSSCSDGKTTGKTDSPRIHIGFIADKTRTTNLDPPMTYIDCNVTLEWFYADYTEPYQVFKTLSHLDTQRSDIDLIVLLDFDQKPMQWGAILETQHKEIIKLHRKSGHLDQATLRPLVSQLTNGSCDITNHVITGHTHCHVDENIPNRPSGTPYFMDTIMDVPPLILANLAAQQGWKSVNVIYDTHSEHVTRLYLDSLSQQGIVFGLQNFDEIDDFHAVLFEIYNRAVHRDQKLYISVTCSLGCLFKVLDSANKFDMKNTEEPTLLKQFSRWMLLVYDYTPVVAKVIETIAHDLDNVAVVPIPEFNPPSGKYIIAKIQRIMNESITPEFDNDQQRKEAYLKNVSQTLITMDQTASCIHYNIDSLLWTHVGLKLQSIGRADLRGRVEIHGSELFPNTQYGYGNRTFKVATINTDTPYVTRRFDKDNKTVYEGIYIDLLIELSRILNFTYYITEPSDSKWGVVDRVENGTEMWNGLVGLLQRREVDFVAAPLTTIPARDKIIDFSYPVSYEYTSIIVKQPDPNAVKWRTLINPFKWEVLLYIGVSLPIVTVLVYLVEKFGPYYSDHENARIRKERGGLHHLHDAFWYMYGALLCQGGCHLPDSFAGRTYVSAWWIFCIIIVGTYGGNLIAFLTVSLEITPFNTLEEMVSLKGTYKWGTLGGMVLQTVFTTSSHPVFRKVGDAMIEFNNTDPDIFHESLDFHKARVASGFYAYMTDTTSIELMMAKSCDLTTIEDKMFPMKDGFGFQHNSPLTQVFSQQIMKSHEAGLLEIWRRKWWPKQNFCANKAKFEAKPITLLDVQSGFYVCLVGIFLGTAAFVAEVLVFKIRKKRNTTGTGTTDTSEDPSGSGGLKLNNDDILY